MKKLSLSIVAVLAASAIAVALSSGSSHRVAPGSSLDPTGDWTDVYFFTPNNNPDRAAVGRERDPVRGSGRRPVVLLA